MNSIKVTPSLGLRAVSLFVSLVVLAHLLASNLYAIDPCLTPPNFDHGEVTVTLSTQSCGSDRVVDAPYELRVGASISDGIWAGCGCELTLEFPDGSKFKSPGTSIEETYLVKESDRKRTLFFKASDNGKCYSTRSRDEERVKVLQLNWASFSSTITDNVLSSFYRLEAWPDSCHFSDPPAVNVSSWANPSKDAVEIRNWNSLNFLPVEKLSVKDNKFVFKLFGVWHGELVPDGNSWYIKSPRHARHKAAYKIQPNLTFKNSSFGSLYVKPEDVYVDYPVPTKGRHSGEVLTEWKDRVTYKMSTDTLANGKQLICADASISQTPFRLITREFIVEDHGQFEPAVRGEESFHRDQWHKRVPFSEGGNEDLYTLGGLLYFYDIERGITPFCGLTAASAKMAANDALVRAAREEIIDSNVEMLNRNCFKEYTAKRSVQNYNAVYGAYDLTYAGCPNPPPFPIRRPY